MRFRPAPIPTVFVVLALIILANLSAWQWGRHVAATTHIEAVHQRLRGELATVSDLAADPATLEWRPAHLSGRFDDDRAMLIAGRFEFGKPGYDVIVPFQVDGGPIILVNRGWIPMEGAREQLPALSTGGAPVRVEGLLLLASGGEDVVPLPANAQHPERWPMATRSLGGCRVGLLGPPWGAMAATLPEAPMLVLVVGPELTRGQSRRDAPLPAPGYVAEPQAIDHFSYAGQWALIAVTLIALWGWAGWRRGQRMTPG